MKRRRGPWRKPPYYKIRLFDPILQTWTEDQKVFDSMDEAEEAARKNPEGRPWRVIHVTDEGRQVARESG